MKSYYYVYKHGDNAPRVRHATLKIAQDEAERLAAKEPGKCFEILQCVGYSSTAKASTFWMDGEEPEDKTHYRDMFSGEWTVDTDEYETPRDSGIWKQVEHAPYVLCEYNNRHRRPL